MFNLCLLQSTVARVWFPVEFDICCNEANVLMTLELVDGKYLIRFLYIMPLVLLQHVHAPCSNRLSPLSA